MTPAELHSAGATVVHDAFKHLEVPTTTERPSREFVVRWVQPFYMTPPESAEWAAAFEDVRDSLDDERVASMLSHFNWRPRLVAAHFAVVIDARSSEDVIGRLLLRSDVCYAGGGYALALAHFNTPAAVGYLCTYLDYYLERPGLNFDQPAVMSALASLDEENETSLAADYRERWERFLAQQRGHGQLSTAWVRRKLSALRALSR